jgi:hypothetical protein
MLEVEVEENIYIVVYTLSVYCLVYMVYLHGTVKGRGEVF